METSFFPLYVNGGFLLPWKPEFWSNLPQNLMQPFPHSSDATHKIWSRLASWLQRYTGLKVWTTTDDGRRRTDDGPLLNYKLTLWAFGSGELKTQCCTICDWPVTFFRHEQLTNTRSIKSGNFRVLSLTHYLYLVVSDQSLQEFVIY